MYRRYRIAGLVTDLDCDYPRTIRQAEAYREDTQEEPAIRIPNQREKIPQHRHLNPELSLEDWEYVLTCQEFYLQLLDHQGMMVHASAVVLDGKAYLFSADSGTGKSTHTQLWLKRFPDAYILNDDKPAVRLEGNQLFAYGTPWSGKTDWNVNQKVPLGGLVFLQRSEQNWVRPASGNQMVNNLLKQTLRRLSAPRMEKMLDMADALLRNTKVLELGCNISLDAVDTVYQALVGQEEVK